MRRIHYPDKLDDFSLPLTRVTRNALLTGDDQVTVQCLAYAIRELERRLGVLDSVDRTSHDYRLRQIEAALGIAPQTPSLELANVSGVYADQWQCGKILLARSEELVVALKYPASEIADIQVFGSIGYVNYDVGATCDGINLYLTLPGPNLGLYIDWAVQGAIDVETSPRIIDGTLSGVTPAGAEVTFTPAWASLHDYVVLWTSDDGFGAEVELAVTSLATKVTFVPVITCDITYKIIQVTQ
jgi:hypothetical protein